MNAIVPSLEGYSRAYITCRTEAKGKDRALSSRHQLRRQLKAVGRFNASTGMTAPPRGVSRHWAVEWCSFNRAALSNGTLAERPKQSFLCRFAFLLSFFSLFLLLHFFLSFPFQRPLLVLPHISHVFFFFFSRFFPSRVTHNLPVFPEAAVRPRWRCFHSCRNL